MKLFAMIVGISLSLALLGGVAEAQVFRKRKPNPPAPPPAKTTPAKTDNTAKDDKGIKDGPADGGKTLDVTESKDSKEQKADTKKLKPVKLAIKNQTLAQGFRVNTDPMYALKFGKQYQEGTLYEGLIHPHWSFCYWDPRYRCYCFWDPCVRAYYYWCQPDGWYYPVSYCRYGTYCWAEPQGGQLPPPSDDKVPLASVAGDISADDGIPVATPIEPTSVVSGQPVPDALPTALAPPPVRPPLPVDKK